MLELASVARTIAGTLSAAPPVWLEFLPFVGIIAIFYFLLIRPQMRQQKEHRERIEAVKKGDQVVTAGGLVGKVFRVDGDYVEIEIAKDVRVKAVKATIGNIIPPGGNPAND